MIGLAPAVGEVGVDVEEVEDAADRVVDQVVDRFGADVEGRDRGDDRAEAGKPEQVLEVAGVQRVSCICAWSER